MMNCCRRSHVAISQFRAQRPSAEGNGEAHDDHQPEPKSVQVLLLLIQHGANGLNLLEAQHVVLVEPLLNPAAEAQAISRVHRIGQENRTLVHRFIVRGSYQSVPPPEPQYRPPLILLPCTHTLGFLFYFQVKDTVEESIYKLNRSRNTSSYINGNTKNQDQPLLTLKDLEALFTPPASSALQGEDKPTGSLMHLPPSVAAAVAAERRLQQQQQAT